MPGLHRVIDTCQIREYPDSTISKVLTVLKWRMITTLNRKLLEKQRVQNRFASYEVHIGHFWLFPHVRIMKYADLAIYMRNGSACSPGSSGSPGSCGSSDP